VFQDVVLFIPVEPELSPGELHDLRDLPGNLDLGRGPEPLDHLAELSLVDRRANDVLQLQHESPVVGDERFIPVELEYVVILSTDMELALPQSVHNHAVRTNQTVHEWHNRHRTLTDLAVAYDHPGLYRVPRLDIHHKPTVDHLNVHVAFRDLATLDARILHLSDDRQSRHRDVVIVYSPIPVREKRPRRSVQSTNHIPFVPSRPEPCVDVMSEKLGLFSFHAVVILGGNS